MIAESRRVLKPDGLFGFVDSVQIGDLPRFDDMLGDFPKMFHEPFYRNYIDNPLEKVIEAQGFHEIRSDTGFFSKVVSAHK